MKKLKFLLPVLLFAMKAGFAQGGDDARALVKEGVQLNDAGKYTEAIGKFQQALKLDTGIMYANFEMGYTLFLSGKGSDGIPYVQKVIASGSSLVPGAYDLLGSIYDKDNQTEKAIATYQQGIKIQPAYQRLHYNLGLVYFRTKQYAEAEKCAIDAIKLDPKHASSMRMYALVCFHQDKRVQALLGFCSFILLEPNTARSVESFNNIQHILQGGVLRGPDGKATIQLSTGDSQDVSTLNMGISMIVLSGQAKKQTGNDLFTYELKSIFELAGQLSEKKSTKDFFDNYLAAYFYKLAESPNISAFARLVSQSTPESAEWIKGNPQAMADLNSWVKGTERGF